MTSVTSQAQQYSQQNSIVLLMCLILNMEMLPVLVVVESILFGSAL